MYPKEAYISYCICYLHIIHSILYFYIYLIHFLGKMGELCVVCIQRNDLSLFFVIWTDFHWTVTNTFIVVNGMTHLEFRFSYNLPGKCSLAHGCSDNSTIKAQFLPSTLKFLQNACVINNNKPCNHAWI